MTAILSTLAGKALAGLLVASLAFGGYFLWESRVKRAALMEAQRDQLAAEIKAKNEAVRLRNEIWATATALPEFRLRLCAQRGPLSGCCKPEPAKCEP